MNKLSLNSKKTKYICFTTKAIKKDWRRPRLSIGGETIASAPSYKYLGLLMDPMLDFAHHMGTLKKKV